MDRRENYLKIKFAAFKVKLSQRQRGVRRKESGLLRAKHDGLGSTVKSTRNARYEHVFLLNNYIN